MENMAQCDSTNNRKEPLQDVFLVNTVLLFCPQRYYFTDVWMLTVAIVFQRRAEASAQGGGGRPCLQ